MTGKSLLIALLLLAPVATACDRSPSAPNPPGPPPGPTLVCPTDLSVQTESGGPVQVAFAPPVPTTSNPPATVTCTPTSNEPFPVGTSTVTCRAVDSVGFATCSFRVEVLRPARTLPFKRFLAFGDSVTEGFLREPPDYSTALRPLLIIPTETYPYKLESMLRTRYGVDDIEVINAGAGGETVLEGRNRIVSELRAAMPDVVLILHGYNDVREIPTSDARDALRTIARAALNRGVEVVLATLFQVGDDREKSRPGSQKAISNLNDRIPGLASSLGLGGVADLELAFGFDRSLLGSDGLHPNPSGYQLIAEVMRDEIIRRFEGIPDAPAPPAPVDAGIVSTRPRQSISRSGH